MFMQCDVIKNWARRFLHKVTSSKIGATLFDTAAQRRVTRCRFYNFVEFIAKTEEFVVLYRYIIKKKNIRNQGPSDDTTRSRV